jgi:hypothetical protein
MTRQETAWMIQDACNPMGVANELLHQMKAFCDTPEYTGTDSIRNDPALRAIAYKLADLFRVSNWDRWDELDAALRPKD